MISAMLLLLIKRTFDCARRSERAFFSIQLMPSAEAHARKAVAAAKGPAVHVR